MLATFRQKNRRFNKDRFDVLSIPNCVIKKGPSHGTRHGNTERQRIYYAAHNAARKARKKNYKTAMGWDEDFCARYDAIADIAKQAERSRKENSWKLALNTSGKNGPMDQRDDYREAKKTHERLFQEHGKGNTRLHPKDQVRQRRSQQLTGTEEGTERVDPKTGWKWYEHPSTSSSPSSWQAASWRKSSSWNARYFLNGHKVFSLTGNGDSFVSDGRCTQDTKPARNVTFPHTCFFLAQCSIACLVSDSHMHYMYMWLKGLTFQVTMECCVCETFVYTFSTALAHNASSLIIPPSLSTHFSLALQSALRPHHQRDLCRFHLLTRFTTATI